MTGTRVIRTDEAPASPVYSQAVVAGVRAILDAAAAAPGLKISIAVVARMDESA